MMFVIKCLIVKMTLKDMLNPVIVKVIFSNVKDVKKHLNGRPIVRDMKSRALSKNNMLQRNNTILN